MRYVEGFFRFWYDFIVGDEWIIAVVVVLAVAATAVATRVGWNAWPLPPLAVAVTLAATAWRSVRRTAR